MLTIANGVEADFQKIANEWPKKIIDGKPVDFASARKRAKKLSQEMADMLEARTQARAAARNARSASTGASSGATK